MTDREVMQMALAALENSSPDQYPEDAGVFYDAITALKAALEQPEQEPVACIIDGDLYFHHEIDWEDLAYQGHEVKLLYTTPPQRQWVGLTDEEIESTFLTCNGKWDGDQWVIEDADLHPFARAIEQAHNIKEGT